MSGDNHFGRTVIDLLFVFNKKTVIVLLILITAAFLGFCAFSYMIAKPGDTISILGIITIKKTPPESGTMNSIPSTSLQSNPVNPIKKDQPVNNSGSQTNTKPNRSPSPGNPNVIQSQISHPFKREGISVLIANDNRIDWDLTQRIALMIKGNQYPVISPKVIVENSISSGQLRYAFNDDANSILRFAKQSSAALLIVGIQSMEYKSNPELDGLITVNTCLSIRVFSLNLKTIEDSFSLSGTGAGYTKKDAKNLSIKNLMDKLPPRLKECLENIKNISEIKSQN